MGDVLETVDVSIEDQPVDFMAAKKMADEVAGRLLSEPVCLSWYDRGADRESPAHASECHGDCEIPGFVEYAVTRGAELKVVVGGGAFVFCYRPLGEFSDSEGRHAG